MRGLVVSLEPEEISVLLEDSRHRRHQCPKDDITGNAKKNITSISNKGNKKESKINKINRCLDFVQHVEKKTERTISIKCFRYQRYRYSQAHF